MADASGIEPDEWAVWRAFRATGAQVSLEVDRRLRRDHELQPGEYATLASLLDAGGRLGIGALALALGWERSRTSHLVARMEARGYLVRGEAGGDRRATAVEITASGRRALLRAVRGHAADVRALFLDQMSAEERRVVQGVLGRVLQNLPGSER